MTADGIMILMAAFFALVAVLGALAADAVADRWEDDE